MFNNLKTFYIKEFPQTPADIGDLQLYLANFETSSSENWYKIDKIITNHNILNIYPTYFRQFFWLKRSTPNPFCRAFFL
jgi:hypothetical protein